MSPRHPARGGRGGQRQAAFMGVYFRSSAGVKGRFCCLGLGSQTSGPPTRRRDYVFISAALVLMCSWNLPALSPHNHERCALISSHPVTFCAALGPSVLYLLGSFFAIFLPPLGPVLALFTPIITCYLFLDPPPSSKHKRTSC